MVLSPEKAPRINDRKWVHIINIDRFMIVNYRSFSTVKIHAFEVEVVYNEIGSNGYNNLEFPINHLEIVFLFLDNECL